jgi:hypothetical protein
MSTSAEATLRLLTSLSRGVRLKPNPRWVTGACLGRDCTHRLLDKIARGKV